MIVNEPVGFAVLQRWYDEMWGHCNASLVSDIAGDTYLRHDVTGANNLLRGEQYQKMVAEATDGDEVTDFTYYLIGEGNFVVALGYFIRLHGGPVQWDWVQMFRVNGGRLAETWLPGMGGNDPNAFPTPATAWVGGEVPNPPGQTDSPGKSAVRSWYHAMAAGESSQEFVADSVRWHDMTETSAQLGADQIDNRLRTWMNGDTAKDIELFLVEHDNMIGACGSWSLGDDGRTWNWVHAFRLVDGKIAEAWINSYGGTDPCQHDPTNLWDAGVLPAGSTTVQSSR